MNFKSTIALLILAGGVGALVWKATEVAPRVGLAPTPAPAASGKSAEALHALKPGEILAVTITSPGVAPIDFKSADGGGALELPGNWPVRRNEIEELVATLTSLRSRFQPVPLEEDADLKPFGLASTQKTTLVAVVTKSGAHTLTFGTPAAEPGENPFTRPAYLQVDSEKELLRLGPDVLPVLNRPAEVYRKRQLFPDADRVKVADSAKLVQEAAPAFLLGDAVTRIEVEGPNGRYVLKRIAPTPKPEPPPDKPAGDSTVIAARLAEVWRIVEPVSDRADPVKLKAVLAAVPDLWVEQFLVNPDPIAAIFSAMPVNSGESAISGLARAAIAGLSANELQKEGPFLERAGLKTAPMKLTLTLADGSKRGLIFGKTTRVNKKTEPPTPSMIPGQPPMPGKTTEEKFYYAKLADNPLIFEVKGDRLPDLYFDARPADGPKAELPGKAIDQLRDPNAVRFEPEQVVGVRMARPGQTLVLAKTKGDKKAESTDARADRWDMVIPFANLAEAKQVSDLLEPIERLSAKKGEIIDRPTLHALTGGLGIADLPALGLSEGSATTITLTSDPKANVPPRTLMIGKHDADKKKMFVMTAAGGNRIDVLDDAAFAAIDRHPRAYRALKLFDLGDDRVESIAVRGEKETYRLQENVGTTGTTFVLTEPVKSDADTEKATTLLRDLASLAAIEYLYDPPSETEVAALKAFLGSIGENLVSAASGSFGLDRPTAAVTINFAGPKSLSPRTLTIGKAREGKGDFYARVDGSPSVFAVKKEVADAIAAGSLGLLPLQLWNGDASGLKAVEVKRGSDPAYALKQTDGTWQIATPFEAAIDPTAVQPLAAALSAIKAERYAAHAAASLGEYGLDKPALRIKFTLTERQVAKLGDEPKEETKERVLMIGKAEGEGKTGRFAKVEGESNPAVFVIGEAAFKDLDKPPLELLDKKLLTVFPPTVTKLETAGPNGSLTLQKEGNDWKPVGATFPVDKPTVDGLLRNLSNLNALKFADYGDTIDWAKYGLDPNAKPLTITVSAGSEVHKLEVGKIVEGTPNDRFARVDGGKAVAVLAVTIARDLTKGKLDFVERTIFKFDPIDLQAVRRSMAGQDLELTLDGTNWAITKPTKFPADQPYMEELSERLGVLRAERVADVEGKDLPKYGLDKPAALLKLELIGKGGRPTEKALKIGGPVDAMKPDGERFAQVEGATTVVVLGGPIAKKLLAAPIKFRERALASFVTADKIVVSRDGKDATFVKAGGNWKMTTPVPADAEDEALRDLHDALARLRAEEIVAEKPADLKPFGLDKADRWRLFNGDKEVLNLWVGGRETIPAAGSQAAGGRAYAKVDKSDLVVLLDMSLTAKLATEYRKRALWEPLDVAQATTIAVDTTEGPGSFKLTKGPLGWTDAATPLQRLSNEAVTEFLDAFAGLKADRFVEHEVKDGTKIYGLDPPRKTITVSTQNGQKRVLLLGRLDDAKRAYAKLNDPTKKEVVRLSEGDTSRVNRDRSSFAVIGEKKDPEPKKLPDGKKDAEPKKDPGPEKKNP